MGLPCVEGVHRTAVAVGSKKAAGGRAAVVGQRPGAVGRLVLGTMGPS